MTLTELETLRNNYFAKIGDYKTAVAGGDATAIATAKDAAVAEGKIYADGIQQTKQDNPGVADADLFSREGIHTEVRRRMIEESWGIINTLVQGSLLPQLNITPTLIAWVGDALYAVARSGSNTYTRRIAADLSILVRDTSYGGYVRSAHIVSGVLYVLHNDGNISGGSSSTYQFMSVYRLNPYSYIGRFGPGEDISSSTGTVVGDSTYTYVVTSKGILRFNSFTATGNTFIYDGGIDGLPNNVTVGAINSSNAYIGRAGTSVVNKFLLNDPSVQSSIPFDTTHGYTHNAMVATDTLLFAATTTGNRLVCIDLVNEVEITGFPAMPAAVVALAIYGDYLFVSVAVTAGETQVITIDIPSKSIIPDYVPVTDARVNDMVVENDILYLGKARGLGQEIQQYALT